MHPPASIPPSNLLPPKPTHARPLGPLQGTGIWKLPTGLLDAGEDLGEGAEREVLEETGVKARCVFWSRAYCKVWRFIDCTDV